MSIEKPVMGTPPGLTEGRPAGGRVQGVGRRLRLSEHTQAALILAGLLALFFWTPLTRGGYYAPTDLLQWTPLFHVAPPGYQRQNHLLSDVVVLMQPAVQWDRVELAAGRLPLWNPYNGAGAPHLANYESAVFSPYTLPYFLLDLRAALVVAAFLKLFSLGFFAYLFFRRVHLQHVPALLGAVAYMFGGYHLVWLGWPQVGVELTLPAGLYCAEIAFQARPRSRTWGLALVGFTLALVVGLLAGHPETYFFSVLPLGGYLLFRLLQTAEGWRGRVWHTLGLTLAAVLALGLSAAQLLPFYEYVQRSSIASNRVAQGAPEASHFLRKQVAALNAFPNLLGSPTLAYYDPALLFDPAINYNETTSNYTGLAALFLAGLAVLSLPLHRSRQAGFFAAVAFLWLLYCYNIGGLGSFVGRLPLFSLGLPNRSGPVWLFSIAALAAWATQFITVGLPDAVSTSRRGWTARRNLVGLVLAWGLALVGGAAGGAYLTQQWALRQPGHELVDRLAAWDFVWPHLVFIAVTAGAAILAVTWAVIRAPGSGGSRARGWVGATLTGLIFLQTGFMLRDYNPTIDDAMFYPVTPTLAEIKTHIGSELTAWADVFHFQPNVNLWYGLRHPGNYDGMGVQSYDALYNRLMGFPAYIGGVKGVRLSSLQVLGIQYLVTLEPGAVAVTAQLTPVKQVGAYALFRVPNSLPRYSVVSQARAVTSDDEALGLLENPPFSVTDTVLLHSPPPDAPLGSEGGSTAVETLEETPIRIRLRVERAAPGWLLALQTYYPGWEAQVNGRPVPLIRANMAYTALHVEAGVSEVVLDYRPRSVTLGLWTSGVSLALLVGITLLLALRGRDPRGLQDF